MDKREKKIVKAHGGDIYGDRPVKIDFSANMNPLGTPQEVQNAINNSIRNITPYPDPHFRKLNEVASQTLTVDKQSLVFGNGSSDLLYRLAQTFKVKRILIEGPAFSEYEKAFKLVGTDVVYHFSTREEQFQTNVFDLIDKIEELHPQMVIAGSPSNPAGTVISKEEIEVIVNVCSKIGAFFLLDSCFFHFVDEKDKFDLMEMVKRNDNLIVLDSFTKIFSMAGIRFGYLVSADFELTQKIRESTQPWPLSTPAYAAALAGFTLMDEKTFLRQSSAYVTKEREELTSELENLGMEVFPGQANYILFYAPDRRSLGAAMAEKGYHIRECGNYEGLDDQYYRIAVRNACENRAFLKAFKSILGVGK